MELKPFNIIINPGNNVVHAVVTPFQSNEFMYYNIYTPHRSFTIKPNKIDSDRLKWTDLHGNESEWYTLAGEAIENNHKMT